MLIELIAVFLFMTIVSIVIPIHNTKKYLRKCLDSVKNQNFDSFEVLMIDDGSRDSFSQ